eukprot:CAMPEP_0198120506 /NCGR_PEP_ID=MMETSP1442-20131203/29273_1 /TAXON_ID= /ORGANISM="Craspedostauros australis, Strain CCMP3328" /LENGTH=56 /DNA_ID=CAMNT_0043779161 /DNA_START=180 /DNA_END=347 /DNA_ORIENTATION=+
MASNIGQVMVSDIKAISAASSTSPSISAASAAASVAPVTADSGARDGGSAESAERS